MANPNPVAPDDHDESLNPGAIQLDPSTPLVGTRYRALAPAATSLVSLTCCPSPHEMSDCITG